MEKTKNGKIIDMKTFSRLFLIIGVISIIISALFGCSNEEYMSENPSDKHVYHFKLVSSFVTFDGNTKTRSNSSEEWEDDAHIYISFDDKGTKVTGTAVYDSSNDYWTLTCNGDIPIGVSGTCAIYYFENSRGSIGEMVSISDNTAVYCDMNGFFSHVQEVMIVNATLTPATGRIRFSGTSGITFRVSGVDTYCSYDKVLGVPMTEHVAHQMIISDSGTSSYLYSIFPSTSRDMTINIGDYSFAKTCPSDVLAIGKSGYMLLPTVDNHEGWNMMKIDLPIVGNTLVNDISDVSAEVRADISSINDWELVDAGFVYSSTTPTPTLYDIKLSCGTNLKIVGKMEGLNAETSYYVRAYAINSKGVSYGEVTEFTTLADLTVWDGKSVATGFGGGVGSKDNPILIYTAAQLKLLEANVNNEKSDYSNIYFKLMNDIDLNNYEWTPIGDYYTSYGKE